MYSHNLSVGLFGSTGLYPTSHMCPQIQQQLELLVNRGAALSDLAFLRILQMVHQQTAVLVEDLKGYELPAIIPRSPIDKTDFSRQLNAAASGSAATAATAVTVTTMLETAMEELFIPYTEGQRYLERESKSLSELYASFLTNFTRYHVGSLSLSVQYFTDRLAGTYAQRR